MAVAAYNVAKYFSIFNNKWQIKKLVFAILLLPLFLCAQAQVLRKPIPDKLVVLSFDDAVVSQATVVAPLLKKYGFGATFFVCEFKEPPFSDKTKYMSWEQIAQLSQMGFEIGNHTQNHTHVNKMDKEHFVAELEYIENKCKEYHIPRPVTFAYPGYDVSPKAFDVLKEKGYLFARAGWYLPYDPTTDHPYLVPSYTSLDNNSKEILDDIRAAKKGKITVLTFHGVPDNAHIWVNTPVDVFEGYLKYMYDNHYKVIAMRDLKAYIDTDKALRITPVFKK